MSITNATSNLSGKLSRQGQNFSGTLSKQGQELSAKMSASFIQGGVGPVGKQGIGIANILLESTDDSGNNIYKILLTDDTFYYFIAPKGYTGDQGVQGGIGPTGPIGPAGPQGAQGIPFGIVKDFKSVDEMNNGYATDNVPVGSFVMINTGNVEDAENAMLFYKSSEQYSFIVDMSGAVGLLGPQGPIGPQGNTGETGNGIVSFAFDALLENGNAIYKVAYTSGNFDLVEFPKSDLKELEASKVFDNYNGEKKDQSSINNLLKNSINEKIAVSDIINALTDTSTNKPLSAVQGKALKDLIDALTNSIEQKANSNNVVELNGSQYINGVKRFASIEALDFNLIG